MDILTLFFDIDEFCKLFEPRWNTHLLAGAVKKRNRTRSLSLSEVMTILVLFHSSGYRNLKQFYLEFVFEHLRSEFPRLVSYNRFVEFQGEALMPLAAYLQTKRGRCTGISFVDSTALAVCENPAHPAAPTVSRQRTPGQNIGRLVLRLQTARCCVRLRRASVVVDHARQHG